MKVKDSIFLAKIDFQQFEKKDAEHTIVVKSGMVADVEIITKESSLLQRFFRNLRKMMNNH